MSPGGSHLVVGSGASAATVALALSSRPDQRVTVLDIGGGLEEPRRETVLRLARQDEEAWEPADIATISRRAPRTRGALPRKTSYGSDYPFRDLGQGTARHGASGAELAVTSSAYGGFTTVWGAQIMPFSPSTFERWPISWAEMEPHYAAVLDEVPLAAEADDLAEHFPLLRPRSGLPPLNGRTRAVLGRYAQNRDVLRRRGITVGRARLALTANGCSRCGLCMTGCPYSLVYSAAQTMDRLRRRPNVRYLGSLLVERIGQLGDQAVAWCRDVRTGTQHEFRADRLFLGAGGLGTTQLVLGSSSSPPRAVELAESAQFVLPFLSRVPVEDPRRPGARDFTLNQFNILLGFDDEAYTTAQVHCYPYNPAVHDALPAALRHPAAARLAAHLHRRLTIGFGYLPSWASPRIRVTHSRRASGGPPALTLTPTGGDRSPMLGPVLRRLARAASRLDLWPLVSHLFLTGAGRSYHFGGTFPHHHGTPSGGAATDLWGRLPEWDRVHLVDGSVLPSVASTTFTLTVMANAHRIATDVLAGAAVPRARGSVAHPGSGSAIRSRAVTTTP